jgi:hypothetical protein
MAQTSYTRPEEIVSKRGEAAPPRSGSQSIPESDFAIFENAFFAALRLDSRQ